MHSVQLTPCRARMVVTRDREMDARGVDVSKGVKRQGRLMRDDTTAQGPRDGGCKVIVFTARQHGHSIHTASSTLKASARGKEAELHRVDADAPCIASRDVTVLLGSKFDYSIPDTHVRNRIKLIRFCTHCGVDVEQSGLSCCRTCNRSSSATPEVCVLARRHVPHGMDASPAEYISGADWVWWWVDATSAYGMLVR